MSARRFLFGFVAASLGVFALWVGILLSLETLGRLKPPTFSNRWEVDTMLARLRAEPPPRIDLLAIGSSTTFYGIDGPLLERELGGSHMLNLAALGLKIHQTEWLTAFYRKWHPEIATVVTVSTLIDFESCSPATAAIFDPGHVQSFLAGHWPELVWHLRQFDPLGVLRAALDLPQRRALDWHHLDSMQLGPRGGQLLDVPREQVPARVVRGVLGGFDPRCYAALDRLAGQLAAGGVRFLFVLAPMRPGYLAEWDPDGRQLAAHRARLRTILTLHGAAFLDAHAELALPEEAFFDAYHLRAPFARQQTRLIVTALRRMPQPEGAHVAGNRLGHATVVSENLSFGLQRAR